MKRYKIKDTVKGLCLVFLGIAIWESARGAAIFLLIMGIAMFLYGMEKHLYKICLMFIRYYRRNLL